MCMIQDLHLFDVAKYDNPSLLQDLCNKCRLSIEGYKQHMT